MQEQGRPTNEARELFSGTDETPASLTLVKDARGFWSGRDVSCWRALLVGPEEIENPLCHSCDLDARHQERPPCITSQALGPTQAPVGAGRSRRAGWWRQARGQ